QIIGYGTKAAMGIVVDTALTSLNGVSYVVKGTLSIGSTVIIGGTQLTISVATCIPNYALTGYHHFSAMRGRIEADIIDNAPAMRQLGIFDSAVEKFAPIRDAELQLLDLGWNAAMDYGPEVIDWFLSDGENDPSLTPEENLERRNKKAEAKTKRAEQRAEDQAKRKEEKQEQYMESCRTFKASIDETWDRRQGSYNPAGKAIVTAGSWWRRGASTVDRARHETNRAAKAARKATAQAISTTAMTPEQAYAEAEKITSTLAKNLTEGLRASARSESQVAESAVIIQMGIWFFGTGFLESKTVEPTEEATRLIASLLLSSNKMVNEAYVQNTAVAGVESMIADLIPFGGVIDDANQIYTTVSRGLDTLGIVDNPLFGQALTRYIFAGQEVYREMFNEEGELDFNQVIDALQLGRETTPLGHCIDTVLSVGLTPTGNEDARSGIKNATASALAHAQMLLVAKQWGEDLIEGSAWIDDAVKSARSAALDFANQPSGEEAVAIKAAFGRIISSARDARASTEVGRVTPLGDALRESTVTGISSDNVKTAAATIAVRTGGRIATIGACGMVAGGPLGAILAIAGGSVGAIPVADIGKAAGGFAIGNYVAPKVTGRLGDQADRQIQSCVPAILGALAQSTEELGKAISYLSERGGAPKLENESPGSVSSE
ncbi:hypothetical protein SCG7086_DO_00010, partial [Chlamydiales bacterium SCGC AG-110-P3]